MRLSFSKLKISVKQPGTLSIKTISYGISQNSCSDFAMADGFNTYFVNSVKNILNNIPGPNNQASIGPALLRNIPNGNHIDIIKTVKKCKPYDCFIYMACQLIIASQ